MGLTDRPFGFCAPVPDTAGSDNLDRTLAALADPHRRQVVELLLERPRPAGELARLVGMSPPAMSRHLRTLRASGLVAESHAAHDARVRIYELREPPMRALRSWLEQAERMWREQLQAFKRHVETGRRPR